MALTKAQEAWLQGFMAFFNGEARPPSGDKRKGWDSASITASGGGYG